MFRATFCASSGTLDYVLQRNNIENQLDATVTDLLIVPISLTCFGQLFAHPQAH